MLLWSIYFVLLYWRYYLIVMSEESAFFQHYNWLLEWTDGRRRVELHPLVPITLLLVLLHFYLLSYKELCRPSSYMGVSVSDVFENQSYAHNFVTRLPVWPLLVVACLGYLALVHIEGGGGFGFGENGAVDARAWNAGSLGNS